MKNNSILIIPIRSYLNAETKKKLIYLENKNKSGIYRWTNTITGKSYVGSSINLTNRFRDYLNPAFLNKELKKGNSIIYRALLKYGYSEFRLDILEYCDISTIIERENYYLDTLKPEYSILKFARSLYGFKHSINTIERMRIINLGRKHSKTARLKMSVNNHNAISVIIKNIESDIVMEFSTITKASKDMGIRPSHFRYYVDRQPIKKKYIIIKIKNE